MSKARCKSVGRLPQNGRLVAGMLEQQQRTTWLTRQHAETSTQAQAWSLEVMWPVGSMTQVLKGT